MNKLKFVMAAGLLAATAACTQTGYDNSYAYNSGYNTRPAYNNGYYAQRPAYGSNYAYNNSGYYRNSYNSSYNRRGPNGDYDRDGVPNSRDIDANGDHVPDAFQR
ncbi:MAG: hypothetical protein EPO10_21845 [Reyranella sp.]|uniref:hypothetical protein n=1 Tax=Reyranella sp. TaxID=1929291 RepID=UPI0012237EDA|nr:hypothetical protein [Reyranella sp.]TAJ88417.1 MAG: hypothetical protein EPO41_21215 [Reyranella sp.]TBR26704.1 MAG: hypothetical protein EPO10_21845 [Reyranella sp.]